MAGSPISINILSNVRDAVSGVNDVADAIDDVNTNLKDLTKEGDSSTDRMEKDFRDLSKQADKTSDLIKSKMREAYKSGTKESKDFSEGASENVQSFKEEAVQNFSEVASSFDGSVQGMVDGVQGLTGGLAAALTPGIGIPAAIIGAIGAAFFQSWVTSTEASKQQVSDMYDDMLESGKDFLTQQFIQDQISEIVKDDGKRGDAIKRATDLRVDESLVLRAMAGDAEAINTIVDAEASKHKAATDAIKASTASIEDKQTAIDAENAKWEANVGWLNDVQRNTDTAASKAQAASDAIAGIGSAGEQAGERVRQGYAKIPSEIHTKVVVDDSQVKAVGSLIDALTKDITIRTDVVGPLKSGYVPSSPPTPKPKAASKPKTASKPAVVNNPKVGRSLQ